MCCCGRGRPSSSTFVRQYGQSGHCFRLRLGWKMLGFLNEPIAWPLGGKAQFVFGIKPLGRFQR